MSRDIIQDGVWDLEYSGRINLDSVNEQAGASLVIAKDVKGDSGGTTLLTVSEDGAVNVATAGGFQVAGVAVTATPAEINMAADSSANTEIVTTTNVLTAAESGKTLILNAATGFVTTLPAVAAGLRFTFYVGATAPSSGNHTIVPNAANDNTIFGEFLVAGATVPASAEGSINIVASTALPGDRIEVFCDGTNWYASGAAAATGAVTFTT